jgi:hypothetical protein
MPSTIFTKIYVDVMDMPKHQNTQSGYKYIVAAHDGLSQAAEGQALTSNTAAAIAKFLWEDIICQYGHIPVQVAKLESVMPVMICGGETKSSSS